VTDFPERFANSHRRRRVMTRAEKLRAAAERLTRKPPPRETRRQLAARVGARERLLAEARAAARAQARWDASDSPDLRKLRSVLASRAQAVAEEQEIRRRLRGEPETVSPETLSPAEQALARSDDEKRRELLWSQHSAGDDGLGGWSA